MLLSKVGAVNVVPVSTCCATIGTNVGLVDSSSKYVSVCGAAAQLNVGVRLTPAAAFAGVLKFGAVGGCVVRLKDTLLVRICVPLAL